MHGVHRAVLCCDSTGYRLHSREAFLRTHAERVRQCKGTPGHVSAVRYPKAPAGSCR